jgi:hypothetical protein
MANVTADLKLVEKFFLDVLDGHLSDTQRDSVGMSFFGVGWQMVVVIEKTMGGMLSSPVCVTKESCFQHTTEQQHSTTTLHFNLWLSGQPLFSKGSSPSRGL